jgi:perosamine synthetase
MRGAGIVSLPYIPVTAVQFGADIEASVLGVLRSGIVAQGPKVAELERHFAEVCSTTHAVAVNNGTTALVLALEVLDLKPGDEVVTSAFTFVATVNAALEAGATVRFADIEPADFCISPATAAAAITDRTRVVLPVHLYGQAADGPGFKELAERRGLRLVEDCAQAIGATIDGQAAGSFGIGCFSLYATKNVTSAEGGMLTTDDDLLADRMRLLRNQGMRARYQYEAAGHNYRLTDLAAAVAVPQMEKLGETMTKRRSNAARLTEDLDGIPGLVLPTVMPRSTHVWHQFTVRVTAEAKLDRDGFATALHDLGIGSGIYYPKPCYDYDCYRDHPRVQWASLPETERASREVISLPIHPLLSDSDLDRIGEAVRKVLT